MSTGTLVIVPELALRISRLPLHKPIEAENELAHLLDALIAEPPAPETLFDLLEYARTSLHFVRAGASRHFQENTPTLAQEAEEHFQRGLGMWQRMVQAYTLCAGATPADGETAIRHATLLHRCLYYTAMQILDHYRAKRQLPPGIWQQTNRFFARAEADSLSRLPVLNEDAENESSRTHCQALYAALLLLEFAQPFSRNAKELDLLWGWLEHAAHLVRVGHARVEARKTAFLVDLDSDQPLRPMPGGNLGSGIRALGTSALIAHLRHLLDRMTKTPEQVHLDADNLERARWLLTEVIATWALSAMPRRYRRTPSSGMVRLCSGFHNMHYFILGREFAQPGDGAKAHHIEYKSEEWLVIDQNPCGFRLARNGKGAVLENHQLVAICPHDGEKFLLGQIHWIMQEQSGRLVAGLAALPGIPQAIGVRVDERVKGQKTYYLRAFLLPALPAIQAAATLILPQGLYQPGLPLDVCDARGIVLKELIHRGGNFDRVSFVHTVS